jgi:hypothetical protein
MWTKCTAVKQLFEDLKHVYDLKKIHLSIFHFFPPVRYSLLSFFAHLSNLIWFVYLTSVHIFIHLSYL